MTTEQIHDPVNWLRDVYHSRRAKNPLYSLRAFSRALSIPSGRMSEILSRKRPITLKLGQKIVQSLGVSPETGRSFLEALNTQYKLRKKESRLVSNLSNSEDYTQLSEEAFQMIADWKHFTLMSLIETDDFRYDVKWIGDRLGITSTEVRDTIDRLLRLNVVKEVGDDLVLTHAKFTTTNDIESRALKFSHRQTYEQAIDAMEKIPLTARSNTAITMAIDPSKIPLAKNYIKAFRRDLSEILETGARKEVYVMSIALFPMTRIGRSR